MVEIKERIVYGEFDSKDLGFFLIERSANRPDEKSVHVDIPYFDGHYDFTRILGKTFYKMRKLSYTFRYFNNPYENRKYIEQQVKRLVSNVGEAKLFDTHDRGGYWLAKNVKTDVVDDHERNAGEIHLEFLAQPYFIIDSDLNRHLLWDEFWFPDQYENKYWYRINGFKRVQFYLNGDKDTTPIITVSSDMKIKLNGQIFKLKKGKNEIFLMLLKLGVNDIEVSGNGTIEFTVRKEVMI